MSARTTASLEWTPGQRTPWQVLVTPYFHTALYQYNKEKLGADGSNYLPYGFGVTIGLGLNLKNHS